MKAYKTWSQNSENIENIPGTVPSEVQECSEEQVEALESLGFTVVSDEEYENYLESQESIIAAWQATRPNNIPPVTNQQLRTALVNLSFQQNKPQLHPEAIRAFIENLAEPTRSLAIQQWEYSNEMIRNNPLVNSMASSLGLTQSDLDAIWVYAKTLSI